jgi:pilus assembly protein Flp/PilA
MIGIPGVMILGSLPDRPADDGSAERGAAMRLVLSFLCDEQGPAAVEYAVMLALILAVIIGSIVTVGQGTGGMWSANGSAMQAVGFGS